MILTNDVTPIDKVKASLEEEHARLIRVLEGREDIGAWPLAEYLNIRFPVDVDYRYSDFNPWDSYLDYAKYHLARIGDAEVELFMFDDNSLVFCVMEEWFCPEGQL